MKPFVIPLLSLIAHAAAIAAAFGSPPGSGPPGSGPPGFGPPVVIEGPSQAAAGALVVLEARRPAAGSGKPIAFAWSIAGAAEGDYHIVADGRQLVFATARPGRYLVFLAAGSVAPAVCPVDGAGECRPAPRVDLLEHELRIGPPPPAPPEPPPPGPGPNPHPEPTPPPDRFGVIPKLRTALAELSADTLAKRGDLAGAFEGVAARIAAGTLGTAEQIVRASAEENRRVLGSAAAAWRPWFERLNEVLQAAGLETPADHADAWRSVAAALRLGPAGRSSRKEAKR